MAKKKPKKPKASASLKAWENFDKKMKAYHSAINGVKAAKKKKETLIKKYS